LLVLAAAALLALLVLALLVLALLVLTRGLAAVLFLLAIALAAALAAALVATLTHTAALLALHVLVLGSLRSLAAILLLLLA
jgi:hypothetical protein